MGPNEGKTFLEQAKCVARALTAFTPINFDSKYVLAEKMFRYAIENDVSLRGKWVRQVRPSGDWYVLLNLGFSGKSRKTLPKGEKCAATFYCSEKEANNTLSKFKEAVSILEKNVVIPDFFQNLVYGLNFVTSEERKGNFDKQSVENLKRTVVAVNPDFNKNMIIEFRGWLDELARTSEVLRMELSKYPSDVNHYLVVLPRHLLAFYQHLAEERQKYCVDGYLFGSVATIYDICEHIAPLAAKDNPYNGFSPIESIASFFSLMAIYLTSSEIVDPGIILAATAKRAITSGYSRELIEIVDEYQDIISQKTAEALEAKTNDDALNLLYDAIPYAFGAYTICLNLRSNPNKIDPQTLKKANGKFFQLDENLVRLQQPFSNQITDFYGHQWKRKKMLISEYKKDGQDAEIERAIRYWTQEIFLFPKSVINGLFREN